MSNTHRELVMEMAEELLSLHSTSVLREIEQMYDSGAVDVREFRNLAYTLPKILLTASLRRHTEMFAPQYSKNKMITEDLKHF